MNLHGNAMWAWALKSLLGIFMVLTTTVHAVNIPDCSRWLPWGPVGVPRPPNESPLNTVGSRGKSPGSKEINMLIFAQGRKTVSCFVLELSSVLLVADWQGRQRDIVLAVSRVRSKLYMLIVTKSRHIQITGSKTQRSADVQRP